MCRLNNFESTLISAQSNYHCVKLPRALARDRQTDGRTDTASFQYAYRMRSPRNKTGESLPNTVLWLAVPSPV